MPNRIIKESYKTSPEIDELTWFEECVWNRLVVTVDDYGRYDGRIVVLKNELFPTKEDISKDDVERAITKLSSVGLIVTYNVNGRPYIMLTTWEKHQQIRAKKSKYPSPDEGEITCNQMISDDSKCHRNPNQSKPNQSNSFVADEKPKRTHMVRPTLEDVQEYISEKGYSVDAERFYSYYESNGWKVGKNPMKNWKAAVATWQRSETGRSSRATIRIDTPQWHKDGKYNKESDGVVDEDLVREIEELKEQMKGSDE